MLPEDPTEEGKVLERGHRVEWGACEGGGGRPDSCRRPRCSFLVTSLFCGKCRTRTLSKNECVCGGVGIQFLRT